MNNHINQKFETLKLVYFPDLAKTLFAPLSDQPWAMLLHSASQTHPDSRYDILVAKPLVTLETENRITKVTSDKKVQLFEEDPFALLDRYINTTLPETEPVEDIPFTGGALGYFSYDLGRCIEKLPQTAKADIDIPDMAVGIYDWAVIVDHQKKQASIVGFDVEEKHRWLQGQAPLIAGTDTSELRGQAPLTTGTDTSDLRGELRGQAPLIAGTDTSDLRGQAPFSLTSSWASNMTRESYKEKFDAIQKYLHSGDCYQINLTQRFSADYAGSEWQAYLKLEKHNKAPFSAYIKTSSAAILSVSPERLLLLDNQVSGRRKVETKPIKGTRPRSSDPVTDEANMTDLQTAEKDQAENLMIVDLLRNDIGRVATPGTVSVPKLFDIESFPYVHHLVSTVTAELDNKYSATDLLRACFPGGSITGAPKVRAMEIIEELEPHRRSAYCGSIGYISRCGKMDTSITIRTLIAHNNKLHAWAGGGIVADSEWASEYQETLDKLSKILPVLEQN